MKDLKNTSPQNVIRPIDGFIEQMRQTRKTLALSLSLAISSIVVAPVSIGLSNLPVAIPILLCYS